MPENPENISLIWKIGGPILAALGSAVGIGKYSATLVKKKEIYDKHGNQIYESIEAAKKARSDCQNNVTKEITGINEKLTRISDYLVNKNKEDMKTAKLMGRIEQFIEDNKKR